MQFKPKDTEQCVGNHMLEGVSQKRYDVVM